MFFFGKKLTCCTGNDIIKGYKKCPDEAEATKLTDKERMIFMMKGTKVLSVLLAGVMSMSCLGMHAFAVQDANEYPSVSADLDADQLQEWYDEVVYYHFYDKTEAELTALTLSEPYYYYNFYDMAVDEGVYVRIVSLNGEVVGLSTKQFEDGVETGFAGYGEYDLEYVEEGLDNNGKILFGRAWVDGFPCGLVYVDGTMYSYTGAVGIEQGETDLVFGEIAYSDPYWTDSSEEADGALLPGCLLPSATTETALDPNDYESIDTGYSEEQLLQWEQEILSDLEWQDIEADTSALTFSEPYYTYNFYDMALSNGGYRIVFENGEIIGLSFGYISSDGRVFTSSYEAGAFEYLADALENSGKILFGSAIVNHLPCGLIYVDGIIYSHATVVLEHGPTDLVFGEIPYSEYNSGMPAPDEDALQATTTTETTEPTEIIPAIGDVNLDGQISLRDVVYVKKIIAGTMQANEEQTALADCCADGRLNASDATALLEYILEMVETLPVTPE